MASSSIAYAAPSATPARRLALATLPRAALVTLGLATLLNVAQFYVASAIGLITPSVEIQTLAGPQPLDVTMVATMTVLQMLLGVAVLAAIIRFRPAHAERTWQIVAGVALVLSFAMPVSGIPGAPLGYILALEAMHVVAGVLAIWMLPALARKA
ncbi:MAG TPA: DUF6069 family protein [Chloroflexota bacterium]|nr:DUF6069 family protein [Chloroflexota bacterium]